MALLDQIENAVSRGDLPPQFTTADVKQQGFKKADGTPYSEKTLDSECSSSVVGGLSTKTNKRLRKVPGTDPQKYEFI